MTPNPYRGQLVTRYLKALAVAHGVHTDAIAYASGQGPEWAPVEKAARDALDTTSGAALLTEVGRDLLEFVRPLEIPGRLAGLRRVPLATHCVSQNVGTGGGFVAEGSPIPVTVAEFSGAALYPETCGAIVVITDELAQTSDPAAEPLISRDVSGAVAQARSAQFIDPAKGGVGLVGPQSVTYGAPVTHSTGASVAQVDADLAAAQDAFLAAGGNLPFAQWVLSERTAMSLSRLRTTGGALAYPGMTSRGGPLAGLPAIASGAVPIAATLTTITLLDASQIWFAESPAVEIDASKNATLELDSAPSGTATVSLWQENLVGVRIRMRVNWRVARAGVVQVIDQVAY